MDSITIIILICIFAFAFTIGVQDETVATLVASGSIRFRRAIMLGAIVAVFGCLFLSAGVAETIGENFLGEQVVYNQYMILAVLLSTGIWLTIAMKMHVAVSTTHTILGSMFGLGIAWTIITGNAYTTSMNWPIVGNVLLGLLVSPILGYFGAIGVQYLLNHFLKQHSQGLQQIESIEQVFRILIIIFVTLNQFSRAGNDAGKAIGLINALNSTGTFSPSVILTFTSVAALTYGIGLFTVGRYIIENVSNTTGGSLRPSEALAIESATAIIIFIATLLGLPVSGGHVLIFAMIGAAALKGEKPDPRSFRMMVMSWILTFPITAALSAIFYGSLIAIF